MRHSSITEAWAALLTNINTQLKYTIDAYTLIQAKFKSIMYPVIKAALPKSEITSIISSTMRDELVGG